MTPPAARLQHNGSDVADRGDGPREPSQRLPAHVSAADLDHLAEVLAHLLLASWRRREQKMADGCEPSAGEEVADDAAIVTRPSS